MEIKAASISSIQYIIIQSDTNKDEIITFPINDANRIFHQLQHFPRDFMQFHDQQRFFELSAMTTEINPAINISVIIYFLRVRWNYSFLAYFHGYS